MNSTLRHLRRCAGLLSAIVLSLSACAESPPRATTHVMVQPQIELLSGGSKSLNYTPWYIHTWELAGPAGTHIGGGGPNVMPVHDDGDPSGGGAETCCTSIPHDWQPDLRLIVRWLVDKKQDGKTPGYWYKAENVQIAKYDGHQVGSIWVIFLPGDRVRLMVADGNSAGGNDLNHRPPDNDPYIVQGVRDDEWNRLYRKGGNAQ
ncbi:DUF3304 domain-containing protein [Burkholderia sp. BCC1988]|uniref:DUF3304 domain-containing protein n=1 Tax=Burkholderia sp. BCC1988 TaxID=2817443 RepID=UPI002AB24693|nr:DUF3304 domain-containing protein [Burkholderia sp. BCC1988]